MKWIIITSILFVAGCGSGPLTIDYVETTKEKLVSFEDNEHTNGYATWVDGLEGRECTIYMMPMDGYLTENRYHEVLGHEMRHCLEGNFH